MVPVDPTRVGLPARGASTERGSRRCLGSQPRPGGGLGAHRLGRVLRWLDAAGLSPTSAPSQEGFQAILRVVRHVGLSLFVANGTDPVLPSAVTVIVPVMFRGSQKETKPLV